PAAGDESRDQHAAVKDLRGCGRGTADYRARLADEVRSGKIARAGAEPGMSGIVFIISAPSGSGKTTLTNELRQLVPNLEFSISYTTRAPRGSEQNGREYFFISGPQFQQMIKSGDFLEYAEVFGNC